MKKSSKVAVVGTGISGMSIAWLLHRNGHDVVVYEKEDRVGGHTNTVEFDWDPATKTASNFEDNRAKIPRDGEYDEKGTQVLPDPSAPPAPGKERVKVDTGFIVYNELNYPNMTALFDILGVPTIPSDMSFAISYNDGALEWSGTDLSTLFAQKRNFFRPSFWRMVFDFLRFNKAAEKVYGPNAENFPASMTLGDYLQKHRYSEGFKMWYFLPMCAAIWSAPFSKILQFPLRSLLVWMNNHHLLQIFGRPRWRTVDGGSREYMRRLIYPYKDSIRTATPVVSIRREADRVWVKDANGGEEAFDHVVMASHGDQTYAMISDPTQDERAVLSNFRFSKNTAVVHTDASIMPKRRNVWCAWNYSMLDNGSNNGVLDASVSVTYWMNRLQAFVPQSCPLFVTLNPVRPPAEDKVIRTIEWEHPIFDGDAIRAQQMLSSIQGTNRTWYCGAYCRFGFHEDGIASSVAVAKAMGLDIPWDATEYRRKQPPPTSITKEIFVSVFGGIGNMIFFWRKK